jgi:ribosomal protein S18 acetylase RimI-like enzyme
MNMEDVTIRPVEPNDNDALWAIIEPVVREGNTYALDRDLNRADALAYWLDKSHDVYVAIAEGQIAATYYLKANQHGGGRHVANCGYMTAAWAQGRGLARKMCVHSMKTALTQGFKAMQFNFVISSNHRAIRLWETLGFEIIGRLPESFMMTDGSAVDALIMYQTLAEDKGDAL